MGAGVRAFREFEADGQVLCAEHSGGAVGVDRPRSSRPSPPNPFAGEPRLYRNALSAAMVRTAGPGSYVVGNGLMLRVKAHGTRQWVQRLTIHGRRVDLGFGSAELVSLADVHRAAADNRAIARTGGDPRRIQVPTFAAAEEACFAEKLDTWRTKSPARNWRMAVDKHVLPKLGGVRVDRIGTAAVYEVLRLLALAGKHAMVKTVGAAITAGADQRVPLGGLARGDGAPQPAEAGGGTEAPRRAALLGRGRGAGKDRRHQLRALDEAGDPLHGADGGSADRGATGGVGAVRHSSRGVGEAGGVDEDRQGAPGARR